MDAIYQAIHDFDAHLSSKEFSCLCSAIYFTRAALPNPPPMKSLCADIRQQTGCRTAAAVLRCVERAVARIFEQGDKARLASYQKSWFYEAPAPNEFIRVVACSLWKDALKNEHSAAGSLQD